MVRSRRLELPRVSPQRPRGNAITHFQMPIKATFMTGVTGRAGTLYMDFEPERILITINPNFFNSLKISRALAFFPNFLARSRPVMGYSCFKRKRQCFFIHKCDHQEITISRVGNHCSDETFVIKFGGELRPLFPITLFFRQFLSSSRLKAAYHFNKIDLRLDIVFVIAAISRCNCRRALFFYTAHCHAHVFCFDKNSHSARF